MRPRIKTIKSEKVTTSSNMGRVTVGKDKVKFRKDSAFLPDELPLHIKGGLIFDI